ncbi:YadA-like family protein [Paraburkholderia nemoris]|uniref:YadA-like family protein n=1 Tax=Paraburkholderia nemoris TaxID=2793076 RepID=UPI0038B7589E
MNKVYKSVWNADAGTYVAVAETTKARGKKARGGKKSRGVVGGSLAIAATGLAMSAPMSAFAYKDDAMSVNPGPNNPLPGQAGVEMCSSSVAYGINTIGCTIPGTVAGMIGKGTGSAGEGVDGFGLFVSFGDAFHTATQPAFVVGTKSGDLVLHGKNGISMLDNVLMYNNQIKNLGPGDVSLSSTDGVNGGQLYQRTRYFSANSDSNDPSSDAKAMGVNSVASGPYALATGSNSSAYGAHASALVSSSVALGANSVASRNDSVSVGYLTSDGKGQYTRQITNVTAGAAGTDAVNVDQLNAAIKSVSGGGSSGGGNNPNAVLYNDSGMGLITLQGTKGTKITNLIAGDISSAWSTDAVNGSQLYQTNQNVANVASNLANVAGNVTNITNTVNNIVNNGIAGSPLVVLYDTSDRNSVTLGGTGSTSPVKLTNVAAGDISSASSTDAVNGSQLYQTNQNVSNAQGGLVTLSGSVTIMGRDLTNVVNTVNFIENGGGIKYFHTNSTLVDSSATGTDAVAIGGAASASALNSVALGSKSVADRANAVSVGAAGTERQIINVAAGTTDTDAVNVKQLSDAIKTVAGGGSPDAVIYDDAVLHNKVTLGGKGSTTPVALTNVAAGQVTSTSTDAVNGSQLYNTANSVAAALGGGTSVSPTGTVTTPSYQLSGGTYTDVGKALDGLDREIGAINTNVTNTTKYISVTSTASAASATGGESVAIGGGAKASGLNSLSFGAGSNTTANNSIAIGANSVANVDNTVSVGKKGGERRIMNVANGVAPTDAATFGQLTALQTTVAQLSQQSSGVKSMLLGATPPVTDYIAVSADVTGGTKTGTDGSKDAMAIGPTASAAGTSSLAIGKGASTFYEQSTAIGAGANTAASYTTAIGAAANAGTAANYSVAVGYNANVGGANALAMGSAAQTDADGGISIGNEAFVTGAGTNAVALGSNATASALNSVALGTNANANRANTVSVGSSSAQRQVVNMAAGTAGTDAVNVNQLKGVTKMIGGLADVNADGTIKMPTFTVGGQTFTDVGAALAAVATGGSADGVSYDTTKHDKVTLGGVGSTTPVTVANVANGIAPNDAVNVQQLEAMGGKVDSSGNVTNAFVAYDDTTKNTITLKGASGSTKITGLTAGTLSASSTDAVNGTQLYATNQNVANITGNVINITNTVNNITNGNAGVKYFHVNSTLADSSATGTDAMAIGPNAKATANNSVALGANSVASRANTVDVGSRQITDVAAGTQSTDAVNVGQLQALGANVDSSGNITNSFVAYDNTTKNTITLKGASGSTKITGLTAGTLSASSTDAVNGTQLYATNQNVANITGNVINITNTVNNITNGNAGVMYFHVNSTLADSSATGTDAMAIGPNAKATASNSVALGANSTTTANLASAAYLASSGTLLGATPAGEVSLGSVGKERRLTNVAAGSAGTDAVNVSQLQAAVTSASSTASANAVQYDSSSHLKVTLGGTGTGTPPAVTLTNLANGVVNSTSSDAVNGAQLYNTANSVAAALGGKSSVSSTGTVTNPSYKLSMGTYTDVGAALNGMDGVVSGINTTITNTTKYISVVSTASAATASGGEAVAIGGGAKASGLNSLAFGAGSLASADNSIALGANSVANVTGVISVGKKGSERKIVNVANGVSSTDAATFGQLQALQTSVNEQLAQQSSGVKSMLLGANSLLGDPPSVTSYIAVSPNVTGGTTTDTDGSKDAMAIGPTAKAAGVSSLAIGKGASTFHDQSTAIGAGANAVGSYTTVIGAAATTEDGADFSVAVGYNSSVGGVNSLAMGSAAQTDTSGSVAIGSEAYVTGGANSVALGLGATASVANSVALGSNSMADRANTVSVGAKGAERQVINVAAGTADTDAVNVKQLNAAIANSGGSGGGTPDAVVYDTSEHTKLTLGGTSASAPVALMNVAAGSVKSGSTDAVNGGQLYDTASSVAAALGGDATVDANGKFVKPTYALDGTTYSDVGAALAAVNEKAGTGSANGVSYDTAKHDKVTLGGTASTTPVTLSNVAAGVAKNDAVNVKQLTDAGLSVDTSGNVTNAFVAYDSTSKNKVTLGGFGSTIPVSLTNIAAGQVTQSSKDAINGSQLYSTADSVAAALGGGASVTTNGSVTKPTYTVAGSTYSDVGHAVDALNSLGTTGSPLGVVYDSSKRDKLTLGGNGATTAVEISNVAAGTADNDAVNLKQLKDAGLNVDTAGNVTNAFVAYDNASKNTVTFGGFGSTTPVQLKNVAAASDLTDAVNFGQMKDYVSQNAGSGGTANAVAYDDSSKNTVTLGGAGHDPVTLTNVAAGTNAYDAVNYSQFSSLQSQVNNLAGGGAGDTTYVNINTPASGGTAAVSSGTDAIAIGNGAVASGEAAIAIGKDTHSTGDHATAMGPGASAAGNNSVALGSNSVADRDNSVSVGSAGNERQITNVAAGTQATDAVNLGQLNNAMGGMQQSINNVDRSAAKGIASASALNIVTPYLPGRTTLNAGVANYRGYQAVGLGVSRWNEKGTINYNLGVSSSGGNSTIVRAGIGIVLGN